jgi:signal transduction histidine kinase
LPNISKYWVSWRSAALFWLPAEEIHVDATGRAVREPAGPGRMRTPVRRGDLQLATLVHDEALGRRPNLLESVIAASGLAIEISRLRAEVRRRLAEVEDSRARLVTAGDAERRRLERDLHDGAQQRLVAIGLPLRHVQGLLRPGGEAATEVDATVTELTDAIEELRELARGVRPAGLDDGLATALQELATRSPLRTTVEATDERFEDRVETAAYFVASEAFANVIKHACATAITVSETSATATSSSRCATTASAVPPLPTDRASSACGTEWRRWAGGCASTARLTQAQSSPRSSRAGSDRRGPGAAEGGPEAALRGCRP